MKTQIPSRGDEMILRRFWQLLQVQRRNLLSFTAFSCLFFSIYALVLSVGLLIIPYTLSTMYPSCGDAGCPSDPLVCSSRIKQVFSSEGFLLIYSTTGGDPVTHLFPLLLVMAVSRWQWRQIFFGQRKWVLAFNVLDALLLTPLADILGFYSGTPLRLVGYLLIGVSVVLDAYALSELCVRHQTSAGRSLGQLSRGKLFRLNFLPLFLAITATQIIVKGVFPLSSAMETTSSAALFFLVQGFSIPLLSFFLLTLVRLGGYDLHLYGYYRALPPPRSTEVKNANAMTTKKGIAITHRVAPSSGEGSNGRDVEKKERSGEGTAPCDWFAQIYMFQSISSGAQRLLNHGRGSTALTVLSAVMTIAGVASIKLRDSALGHHVFSRRNGVEAISVLRQRFLCCCRSRKNGKESGEGERGGAAGSAFSSRRRTNEAVEETRRTTEGPGRIGEGGHEEEDDAGPAALIHQEQKRAALLTVWIYAGYAQLLGMASSTGCYVGIVATSKFAVWSMREDCEHVSQPELLLRAIVSTLPQFAQQSLINIIQNLVVLVGLQMAEVPILDEWPGFLRDPKNLLVLLLLPLVGLGFPLPNCVDYVARKICSFELSESSAPCSSSSVFSSVMFNGGGR